MGLLDDRTVVITGAGRGLGEAYARAAADEGAIVIVNDVEGDLADAVARDIGAAGGRAVAHAADVSDWAMAEGLVARCVEEFGRIDALVNNAGEFALALPQEQEAADARRMLDVNVYGTIACGTAALRRMVVQGSGVVLNVTSGEQMGNSATAVYGATKAAVATLTYSWAEDVRAHGVRINAISPNAHTRMADVYFAYRRDAEGSRNAGLPPSANAPLAIYLISDLSAALTGQVLRITGGELMLCTGPAILDPIVRREGWTVEAVAAAVETHLIPNLTASGLRVVRQEIMA
jgi:NAD(P)-dependent dehydrogenase (short-subunit alcohol dehydrogenase family)